MLVGVSAGGEKIKNGPKIGPNLDGNEVLKLTIMGEAVWKKCRHPKGQRKIDLQWYEWRGKDFPFHGIQEVSGSIPLISTKGYAKRLVFVRKQAFSLFL